MNTSPVRIAPLTSLGRGAVATVAVWGTEAGEMIGRRFQAAGGRKVADFAVDRIHFGRFRSVGETEEELVVCRLAADRWEIHCHGGTAAVSAVVAALSAEGATAVSAADWLATEGMTTIQREARDALSNASTQQAATILLRQYHGQLRQEVEAIAERIDHSLPDAQRRLEHLQATYQWGKRLTQPFSVVLCGAPNVGKSSLINALVGFERAIVQDQPGTTRDVVTTHLVADGWLLALSDTAGWRTSDDRLERQGIALAEKQIAAADLVLYTEAAEGESLMPLEFSQQLGTNSLRVVNKCDLLTAAQREPFDTARETSTAQQPLFVSAKTGEGIDHLMQAIVAQLVPSKIDEAVLFSQRQFEIVRSALVSLAANDLLAARKQLQALSAG